MNCKIKLSSLLLLAALPFGALAASPAQPPDNPAANYAPATGNPAIPPAREEPAPLFQQLDSNRDGYVSMEEAKRSAEVTARFKELDTNRDGKVAVPEYNKGMQARL